MTRETEREVFEAAAKRLGWNIEEESHGGSFYRFYYATPHYRTGEPERACHAVVIYYKNDKVNRGTFYNDNGPDDVIRAADRRSTKLAAAMSWLEDVSNKYERWI